VLSKARSIVLILLAAAGAIMFGAATTQSASAAAPPTPVTCDQFAVQAKFNDQTTDDAGKEITVPLEGVGVTVTDSSGATVGEAVSDAKGNAKVCVPAKADYTVTVQTDTLPDGKELRSADTAQISIDKFLTNTTTISFFTGGHTVKGASFLDKFAQNAVNGARLGLIIAMCSVGLSLIFGTTGLTNFAHGEMVTFGALAAYVMNNQWGWSIYIAGPLAVVAGGVFGLLFETGLFGPLRRNGIGLVSQLVVSVGLSILLKNFFQLWFGGRTKPLAAFNLQRAKDFGPVSLTTRDLCTMVISLVTLVAVALALQRTRFGKAARAVSDNPDLAASTGINSQQVIRIVWIVGGALAAMGGLFRALDTNGGVSYETGGSILFLMFAGITLGGLGSAYGALVGGFIVGLFVEMSTLFGVPTELKNVPPLVILILILLVRPQGILGRRERVG
jgi:branched-chain amino acid transport system permease protein